MTHRGTAKVDRQEKYQAYEQHGVGEYWIVDPLHETIEVWTHGEEGRFVRQGVYDENGSFQSKTLNVAVTAKDIFNV